MLVPLGICSLFTARLRLLLYSFWAAMGEAWDKNLPFQHSACIVAYLQKQASSKLTHVIGKSVVAPIRHTTAPELELQAVVYGVPLSIQILREHDVKIDKIYHWTDSSTVLQWLQSAHKKQQEFVAKKEQKFWKALHRIKGDMLKASKTLKTLAQKQCPLMNPGNPNG